MIDAVLLVLFQAAAGAPDQGPQATATTTEKAAEPEMVCKFEYEAGSRVRKTKVCRPKGGDKQEDRTKLQRELDRQGDVIPPSSGLGN